MMKLLRVAIAISVVAVGLSAVSPPAHATFQAENGLIAFQADVGAGNRIYTIRPNGKDLRQVTPDRFDATSPDWSPDGRWIAFSKKECHIALIHPDGTGLYTIASETPGGCERDPAFTPDGQHLIFERFDPVAKDDAIWIMGLHGEDRRRIGTGHAGATTPQVSPDGRVVTFLSYLRGGLTALFGVSIDGGDSWQITPTLYGITFKHDWAPDGSRLVMSDNADDPDRPVNVVTFRPDGTGLLYLTDNQTPDQRAFAGSYSPDGKWIVFRHESGDLSSLVIMRTDGQGAHAVLGFSSFRPRSIDWGPAAS